MVRSEALFHALLSPCLQLNGKERTTNRWRGVNYIAGPTARVHDGIHRYYGGGALSIEAQAYTPVQCCQSSRYC